MRLGEGRYLSDVQASQPTIGKLTSAYDVKTMAVLVPTTSDLDLV